MKAMVDESKKSSKNGVVVFDTFFSTANVQTRKHSQPSSHH